MKDIELMYHGRRHAVPNSWERLSAAQFVRLTGDIMRMAAGELSPGEVRVRLLCDIMGWKMRKFTDGEHIACLLSLASQLTFLFRIEYPEGTFVLDDLDAESRERCLRTDPFHLDHPLARVLRRLDYRYVPDLCFAAQLLPELTVGGETFRGYTFRLSHGRVTCSLTALQYIEAGSLESGGADALPLLAAVLYFPADRPYSSGEAHRLADTFARLDAVTLAAVAFNFRAVCNFLLTRTPFSLLTKFEGKRASLITTDASDALYDLSRDGLGDVRQVEQMNVLTYLRILRKKTIEAVRNLHGMGWDRLRIGNEVGLSGDIIDKIL